MITDKIKTITEPKDRSGVIIGGNMCQWYGGFDSYVVGKQVGLPIYAPTTGRMKPEERGLDITHLDSFLKL